ncbi:hypothetical protein [Arsukibacterium sp.]|uniref:hypothetical protein n=1 Tax=Arsukibacterium sp. TaxID=1977258 RepID=UPI002FDA57ED
MAGINLGNILQNVEQLKSARQNREMNALRMQQAQKQIGYMDEDRQFELGERQNMLANRAQQAQQAQQMGQLRGQVAAGDQGAMRQFIAINPAEGKQILEAYSKMDEPAKKQAEQNIDMLGRMAAYVLQNENPEQAYQQVRQNLDPEAAKDMPEQYDRNFVTMQLARAREIEQLLKPEANPEVKAFGDQDIMFQGGKEIDRTTSNALLRAQQSGSDGDGGLKTADESLMYRQAAELMGGIFDQQGNLQNLDPNTRSKVQALATEATRLRQSGESSSAADAVARAARKLKIDIQDLSGAQSGSTLRTFNPATGKFE